MVFELENLWPDRIPEIGDPGQCSHVEPKPGPTSDCDLIKEKIVIRKKCVMRAWARQDSSVSTHVINENLHNIERLRQNWENIHFNPPYKWSYVTWKGHVPVYYHELKQTYNRWKNSSYSLTSMEDFPPLFPIKVQDENQYPFKEAPKPVNNERLQDNKENDAAKMQNYQENDDISSPKRQKLPLTYAQQLINSFNETKELDEPKNDEVPPLPKDQKSRPPLTKADEFRQTMMSMTKEKFLTMSDADKVSLQEMLAAIFDGPDDD